VKARLLGAMLAGIKVMPRDVPVKFSESGGQTRVDITVRDTAGFGTRIGIADKLQKQMYEDALSVKRLFA
jgi:hypothetical protein